jgi:hypothetical protein
MEISSKAKKLATEARKSATFRGHTLSKFEYKEKFGKFIGTAYCEKCNRYVVINTAPAPNEIDIGGSAVAVGCYN